LPEIMQWDGTASARLNMDIAVRQAEALVTRCRTRFIAPVPRTAAGQQPASEEQVRAAMTSGGIIEERQNQYIVAWNLLKLQGVNLGPAAGAVRGPTLTQQRATLNAQRAEQGLPPLTAQQFRTINQAPVLPAPPAPAPPPMPRPQDEVFGELPVTADDVAAFPPFGGGRQ
jgi:hypothetical protein